jgi:asparagine synthase (glutamine-hydrolysing)
VTFPGHPGFDESQHARKVANWFGTKHLELPIEGDFSSLVERLARQIDDPIADSSLIPTYLVSQLIRNHVTVALGGDGGDELFGGYATYSQAIGRTTIPGFLRIPAISRALRTVAKRLPLGTKGRSRLISWDHDPLKQFVVRTVLFDESTRRTLLRDRFEGQAGMTFERPEHYRVALAPQPSPDILDAATRIDFASYLPDDILHKVDRASMAVSLEIRAPFLDQRIIEFAFGQVPSSLKASRTERKILLKQLGKMVLPPDFDLERKQGFSIPTALWGSGNWHALCADVLGGAGQVLFDRKTLGRWIRRSSRNAVVAAYLYPLVMFELWRCHNRISV